MKKQVCVIGLGRFGSTMAKEFYQAGHDVLAIDTDDERIQDMLGDVTYAVRADATNETTLRELGVPEFDVAAIALGSDNMQASILITVTLKSMNIPHIIARAGSDIHGDTLDKIGADKIVYPEMESAKRVAHVDFNDNILDYMEIAPNAGLHLINVARGGLIDQDALRVALEDGRVARASLDVADPEPLPGDHWLFAHPRVRLSPHVSWSMPGAFSLILDTFIENLGRYQRGETLEGLVDRTHGY